MNVFDNYIAQYSADLTRLCISLCGNVHDAEDLFQNTWYKAIKNFKQYDFDAPFDKWLYSICVNCYRDSVRLFFRSRQARFSSNEEKDEFLNSIPDISPPDRDEYLELHAAVSKLPVKQKTVLVLRYYKDYSYKEISEMLGISEGTVKSRLNTAKRNLKRRLNYE